MQEVTSCVLGQVSPECDSRFFGEIVDLAIQDCHTGSAPGVPAAVSGTTGASRPSQKDLGKGGSKKKSTLWALIQQKEIQIFT